MSELREINMEISSSIERTFELIKKQYELLLKIDSNRAKSFLLDIYLPAGELCDKIGDAIF